MGIEFKQKGSFTNTLKWLLRIQKPIDLKSLAKFGEAGVTALSSATPIDTGKTAGSWNYSIEQKRESVVISFNNTNINDGVPIAIILQYGHGTRNGGWVQGIDYINPAIQPIFNDIVNNAWQEVTRV